MAEQRRSRNDPARTSKLPVSMCNQCSRTWQSNTQCHCASCCRHFGSVYLFDRHRINFDCEDPLWLPKNKHGEQRVILDEYGVYREPPKEGEW